MGSDFGRQDRAGECFVIFSQGEKGVYPIIVISTAK